MSTLVPMSPSEFQGALNKYLDLHRAYLFRIMIFDGSAIGSIAGGVITELISASATPVASTTSIALGWQGSKSKVAGKTDFQDWNVTVRDDAINAAHTYFQLWRDKVYNVKTGASASLGTSSTYKRTGLIIMLTNGPLVSVESAVGARGYILHGIWPKEVGQITLDYSTEAVATFPVTLSMDYFESLSAAQLAVSAVSNVVNTLVGF